MEFPNIVETKSKGEKMYLISAYFDEHTTRQLQRFIDAVAQNTGNTYMIDNNVPPHLTISSFETRNPQNLCDDFVKLSELESHDINIFCRRIFAICYLCDARIGFAFAANCRKGL